MFIYTHIFTHTHMYIGPQIQRNHGARQRYGMCVCVSVSVSVYTLIYTIASYSLPDSYYIQIHRCWLLLIPYHRLHPRCNPPTHSTDPTHPTHPSHPTHVHQPTQLIIYTYIHTYILCVCVWMCICVGHI